MPNLPSVTALAGWYGANRILARHVGQELSGCSFVAVPFAGGMCELAHIEARSILVNDLNRNMVNMARVAADPVLGPKMYRQLKRQIFHADTLAAAQKQCQSGGESLFGGSAISDAPDLQRAVDYFIACWMARGGNAGTATEFNGELSIRYNANGGDSNTRYRSAVASLMAWRWILIRCNFKTVDALDLLRELLPRDSADMGIYCDPPFPGPGDKYKHRFSTDQHRTLALLLSDFRQARVVCRFYDHPLIRELYPEPRWNWRHLEGGRKQTNADAPEVLLINGRSLAQEAA